MITYQLFIRFLKEHRLYNQKILSKKQDKINKLVNKDDVKSLIIYIYCKTNHIKLINDKIDKKIDALLTDFEDLYFKNKFNKTRKELFDEFVDKEGIYHLYQANAKILTRFNERYDKNNSFLKNMINDAFIWEYASGGFNLWSKVSNNLEKFSANLYLFDKVVY